MTDSHSENSWYQAYIGLGANLNNPQLQLRRALESLKQIDDSRLIKVSSYYRSSPMGPADQPDFINAVALLETQLDAMKLLDQLQAIERNQGRVRKDERWGPRTLDLDIILFGEQIINNQRLIIPHYGASERNFVLLPLAEIAPELVFPDGRPLCELINHVSRQGIERISDE